VTPDYWLTLRLPLTAGVMACLLAGALMVELFAYTDGACSGNPGPGGWGALLEAREATRSSGPASSPGGEALTTNNRMELMAAIAALEALARADRRSPSSPTAPTCATA
jgi:hypothetical protein